MSAEVADIFDGAADLIERHGWCKGVAKDERGRLCAIGALHDAAMLTHCAFGFMAEGQLEEELGRSVAEWNDEPVRTVQEVLDALRAAAKVARS